MENTKNRTAQSINVCYKYTVGQALCQFMVTFYSKPWMPSLRHGEESYQRLGQEILPNLMGEAGGKKLNLFLSCENDLGPVRPGDPKSGLAGKDRVNTSRKFASHVDDILLILDVIYTYQVPPKYAVQFRDAISKLAKSVDLARKKKQEALAARKPTSQRGVLTSVLAGDSDAVLLHSSLHNAAVRLPTARFKELCRQMTAIIKDAIEIAYPKETREA